MAERRWFGWFRRNRVAILTWTVIIGGWEVVSHLVITSQLRGIPIVPSWEFVFTDVFKALSGSWPFDFLAPNPRLGGEETYLGAFLALGYHSGVTLYRLSLGLIVGVIAGVGSGFAISYWQWVHRLIWSPMNILRMAPLLAAIPLFQFWLGATTVGTTVFIAFGVWVFLLISTMTSVQNVQDVFVEYAQTLGASRFQSYRTVVMPAALPELRTGLLLAAGLSWSLAVGAEYIGMPNGLGAILATAQTFTNTGRMMLVAITVALCALTTFAVLDRLFARAVRWVPRVKLSEGRAHAAMALGGPLEALEDGG